VTRTPEQAAILALHDRVAELQRKLDMHLRAMHAMQADLARLETGKGQTGAAAEAVLIPLRGTVR
jgi:hypothetical protein